MDHYRIPDGHTGSPTVEVTLSPLDIDLRELPKVRLQDEWEHGELSGPKRVHTGLIPRLKLGDVFRDGVLVDHLRLPSKTFSFDNPAKVRVCSISEVLDEVPENWNKRLNYRILNRCEYPVGPRYIDSKCVVASSKEYTLVLPCHEVLRSLYAPHRELALALTLGPWQNPDDLRQGGEVRGGGWSRVADPRHTGVLAGGEWHITLRKRIHDRHAASLANIILDPDGLRAATSIHSHLMDSPFLHAEVPFGPGPMRLTVRCAPLRKGKNRFLAFEITDFDWPRPLIKLFVSRENDGRVGEKRITTDRRKPFSGHHSEVYDDQPVPITADEDPNQTARGWKFDCDGPRWVNGPQVVKLKKDHSFVYVGQVWAKDTDRPQAASGGESFPGPSSAGAADYRTVDRYDPSGRFIEVTEMLTELERAGGIDQWWTVAPLGGGMWHGFLEVWRMPALFKQRNADSGARAWSFIDPAEGRHRGVLVCGIRCGGSLAYWMEIEVRPTEGGFKSLVFRTVGEDPQAAVRALLMSCSRRRGVWPAAEALKTEAPVSSCATWAHSHIGAKRDGPQNIRLNAKRALVVLRGIADVADTLGVAKVAIADSTEFRVK